MGVLRLPLIFKKNEMIAVAKMYDSGNIVILGSIHNTLPCSIKNNIKIRNKLFLMYPKLHFFTIRESQSENFKK